MGLMDILPRFSFGRKPVERPELGFWDLFRFTNPSTGHPIGFVERVKSSVKLGQYHAQAMGNFLKGIANRFRKNPDDMIDRSRVRMGESWRKKDKEIAARNDRVEEMEEDRDGRVSRMSGASGTGLARPGMRVFFNPDRPKNRVGSNHVGPDRQLRHNEEPWPLGKPEEKRASRSIEGPEEQKRVLRDPDPRRVSGPPRRVALESPEAQARRSGKAAADRGADRAREISAVKAAGRAMGKGAGRGSRGADLEM